MAADFDATRAIMGDIVERLRHKHAMYQTPAILDEAADEIARLRAELVQRDLDWERLAAGQRRALDPDRQLIFDKLAERDALQLQIGELNDALGVIDHCQIKPLVDALLTALQNADREAFENWWYASKYCQVGRDNPEHRQTAWDGWKAAINKARGKDDQA